MSSLLWGLGWLGGSHFLFFLRGGRNGIASVVHTVRCWIQIFPSGHTPWTAFGPECWRLSLLLTSLVLTIVIGWADDGKGNHMWSFFQVDTTMSHNILCVRLFSRGPANPCHLVCQWRWCLRIREHISAPQPAAEIHHGAGGRAFEHPGERAHLCKHIHMFIWRSLKSIFFKCCSRLCNVHSVLSHILSLLQYISNG